MRQLIDKLERQHTLTKEEWITLITEKPEPEYVFERARAVREQYYGKAVYTRGLIEFTNHCKNNCLYCGIRRENTTAIRYRLT